MLFANKILILHKLNLNRNISTFFSANAHFNKDWSVGPYPKNNNESIIAAEKYNLHRKEYEPYSSIDYSLGDYPQLPFKGVDLRDMHYPYDIPEYRRNFNEPIHININMIGEDRFIAGAPRYYSTNFGIACFILIFGSLFGSCYISKHFISFPTVTEKQYPWKQKVYYTFEKNN